MKATFLIALCTAVAVGASYVKPPQMVAAELAFKENLEKDNLEVAYKKFVKAMPRAVEEDTYLTFTEIVQKYNYPVEDYYLETSDGYILNLHRIPYGKDGPSENRPALFLMHGILASSADWIIPGPEIGLAYIMADRGYDVWLGNARGNRYSRNHTTLTIDGNKKFWDFSWHEMGTIDLPTMIDFALKTTGQENLFYIGHSQGTTIFYVMCSERPEYNKKIRAQFSLAPIAFMNHMTSPLLKVIALAEGGIGYLLNMIGMYEFLPNDGFISKVAQGLCDDGIQQVLCTNTLFVLCGFNMEQLNTTLLPILMGHTPAGSSTKQFLHFGQDINSGKFRQYDYGLFPNMKKYGSFTPPSYKLSKINAPVYLFYSKNDWLSAQPDVRKLYDKLGNAQGKFLIADDKFNHLDYMFGIDAYKLVYSKVISLMSRH